MISIEIPKEVYTMKAKKSIIKANTQKYKRASKKEKIEMLNDLESALHMHRKYIITLLNNTGKVYHTPQGIKLVGDPTVSYVHRRGRKKKYTEELLPYLKGLWVLSGYRSSLHLRAFITENQSWIMAGIARQTIDGFPKGEREDLQSLCRIPLPIKELLITISSASIERLLKPTKERYKLAHRYRPHPHASVLKKNIPTESHFNKVRGEVGYMELDTVHHADGRYRGSYILTLCAVEIETHWVELRALRNKAALWAEKALEDIKRTVPFKIHTLHPDNGTEILNRVVAEFTQKYGIRYVRSRPYHKNDNPVVESRNFTLIRAHVGYCRYASDEEYEILVELMPLISILHNYFIPTMMLLRKERVGGKVYRRYDINTPYNRVLESSDVSEEKKQELRERKAALCYPELLQRIRKLENSLDQVHRKGYNPERGEDDYISPV